MGAAILFKNFVTEILDAQTEPGDADIAQRLNLVFLECARFAFKGDLLRFVP